MWRWLALDLIAERIAVDAFRVQAFGCGVFVERRGVVPARRAGLGLAALFLKEDAQRGGPQPKAAVMREARP